jgi:hypothetical protein
MSLGYDTSSETLTGLIDLYVNSLTDGTVTLSSGNLVNAEYISTKKLRVNGIDISGMVQGPTGPQGPIGSQGAIGPQGPKGDKGDNGSDANTAAVEAEIVALSAVVATNAAVTTGLVTTTAGLTTSVTGLQGEVGILDGKVATLENQTKFISSTTNTKVSSDLVISNGIVNNIELKTDGTINASSVNTTILDVANEFKSPEISVTNIIPYTSSAGVINVATSGFNETINLGSPTKTTTINLNGTVYINGTEMYNPALPFTYFNQWF